MARELVYGIRRDIDQIILMENDMAETDREITEIQERMMQRAISRLVAEGKSADEARQLAIAALHAPSSFKIPTIDELDG